MVRARFRDVLMWFVTAFDDFVVERTWRAMRRGDGALVARTWRELIGGFPGCALAALLAVAGLVAFLLIG